MSEPEKKSYKDTAAYRLLEVMRYIGWVVGLIFGYLLVVGKQYPGQAFDWHTFGIATLVVGGIVEIVRWMVLYVATGVKE